MSTTKRPPIVSYCALVSGSVGNLLFWIPVIVLRQYSEALFTGALFVPEILLLSGVLLKTGLALSLVAFFTGLAAFFFPTEIPRWIASAGVGLSLGPSIASFWLGR